MPGWVKVELNTINFFPLALALSVLRVTFLITPCVIFKPFFNLMYKDKNIRTKYITQHVINDKHSDNMNFQSRHVSRRLSKETKFGEKKKGTYNSCIILFVYVTTRNIGIV